MRGCGKLSGKAAKFVLAGHSQLSLGLSHLSFAKGQKMQIS